MLNQSDSAKVFTFEDADRRGVAELLAKGMPEGDSSVYWLQRFSQWWDRNPHATPDWPRGCVVRYRERIVGAHAWVPSAYWIDGRVHRACIGTTWYVDTEFRASVFAMALKFKSAPADILIASSAIPAVARILDALHFQQIHPLPNVVFGLTLDYGSLLKTVALRRGASPAIRGLIGLVAGPLAMLPNLFVRRRLVSSGTGDLKCTVANRVDSGFDRLWELFSTQQRAVLIRDAETLAWYAFDPAMADRRFMITCRDQSDRWLGYALFRVFGEPGIERRRANLMDMVIDPAVPGVVNAITSEAVAAARRARLWQIDFRPYDDIQLGKMREMPLQARTLTRRVFLFVRPALRAHIRAEDFYFTGLDGDGGLN